MATRTDLFRVYDAALTDFVKRTVKPVITELDLDCDEAVTFFAPERPYAAEGRAPQERTLTPRTQQVQGLLEENTFQAVTGQTETKIDTDRSVQTFATPRVAVARLSWEFSAARRNNVPVRRLRMWDEEGRFIIQTKRAPRPLDLHYQIDFHARFRDDMNQLLRWYLFHPDETYSIWVDFKYPWGRQLMSLFFSRLVDMTDIDTGEKERWIRFSCPVLVHGWMLEGFDGEDADQMIPNESSAPEFTITQRRRTAIRVRQDYALDLGNGNSLDLPGETQYAPSGSLIENQ